MKEVLVIFKTHLDLGFTDLAEKVLKNYLENYIPNAIKVGYELKGTGTEFIWTTGSYLVTQALAHDDGTVKRAIRDGIIRWHALPFTTHTELMTPKLFDYGVSLSSALDRRFGKKTIAAKMTDVPGHTIGMIPILKRRGVEFLHIGVNPATPIPDVPPLFKWRCGNDEITVIYQGDYGTETEIDGTVIYFAHTGDNRGPQSAEKIVEIFDEIKAKYPGYAVRAATLEDVALKLRDVKNLPVVDKEIGDTWIHGAGTDPKKVSMYRDLLRKTVDFDYEKYNLSNSLLAIPEHTWGKNLDVFFHNASDYYEKDRQKPHNKEGVEAMEQSWAEQRKYITAAENELGVKAEYETNFPDLTGFTDSEPFKLNFSISWQVYDAWDYERYKNVYLRFTKENIGWAIWDNIKQGLPDDYSGKIYDAKPYRFCRNGDKYVVFFKFDDDAAEKFGLPVFTAEYDGETLFVKWHGKKNLRLPNAFWFKPEGFGEDWLVHKMGLWIDPCDIIGSPLITATDYGVKNGNAEIESLDAVLAAPFGRRLLDFEPHPEKRDLYFNLYNNIWNTNFPMWYSDDAVFRFKINHK